MFLSKLSERNILLSYCIILFPYLCEYEDKLRFGIVKSEMEFPFASALTFRYLCEYEDRLRFGIVKSETWFPFASALTFHYLCGAEGYRLSLS